MNKDFSNFIKGLDSKTLAEGIKKAQAFAKTADGQKMIDRIKSGEGVNGVNKNDLAAAFKDNPELLKKINDMLN